MRHNKWMIISLDFLPFFCVTFIIINFLGERFLLSRLHLPLDPQYFNVEVVTGEDYQKLSHPENQTVRLSNGTTITKTTSWDSRVLPMYKPANEGSQYVLVKLKGMAYARSESRIIVWPIFIISLLVLLGQFVGWCFRNGNVHHDFIDGRHKGDYAS